MKNIFCDTDHLSNEAQVESLFVDKILEYLGYQSQDIRRKASIEEFRIGRGSAKPINFKPDYIVSLNGSPFFIVDAKHPNEKLEDYVWQCSSYCLELNKVMTEKTVEYFILTNGFRTLIYNWLESDPRLSLNFSEWHESSVGVSKLKNYLDKTQVKTRIENEQSLKSTHFKFETIPLDDLITVFQYLHRKIWSAEKKSPSAAFMELIKIMFVKFQQDKLLYEKADGKPPRPTPDEVIFSTRWIDSQTQIESPINDPLFKNLVRSLNKDIIQRKRKRFFSEADEINLHPAIIRKVVEKLENIDLFGMDEDVHGRMFEAFLDATVRGQALGQFFTPRDICKLMVHLADIKVTGSHLDKVLDACCGSGGFLIVAMGDMLSKVDRLSGLTNLQKADIREKIRVECLYGIDAGSDPAMYRIARMNMFLHGDGGSKIFFADSLDKRIGEVGKGGDERDEQLAEIRTTLLNDKKKFEVILSNPPFSMTYDKGDKEESSILFDYDLGRSRKSLLSNVMFLERYKDFVSENGKILAIVDDSVLSGSNYQFVRSYIRSTFIIIGVISLPGDAFKRAASRVKASIVIFRLKKEGEVQGDVFMAKSIYLGMDEKIARRIGIRKDELANGKMMEIIRIEREFLSFLDGISGNYSVSVDKINDRLDVKYCMSNKGQKIPYWIEKGLKPIELGSALIKACQRIVSVIDDEAYQLLKVTYDGDVLEADTKDGGELSYSKMSRVKHWDILFSNMGVGRGAVGIVPPYHDGKYVSNEYTILTARSKEEAIYYSTILRTKEILADILSYGTGMNRGRIKWADASTVIIPKYIPESHNLHDEVIHLEDFWKSHIALNELKERRKKTLADDLRLEDDEARLRWLAHKPPE